MRHPYVEQCEAASTGMHTFIEEVGKAFPPNIIYSSKQFKSESETYWGSRTCEQLHTSSVIIFRTKFNACPAEVKQKGDREGPLPDPSMRRLAA